MAQLFVMFQYRTNSYVIMPIPSIETEVYI
jgi:hypothetical protein